MKKEISKSEQIAIIYHKAITSGDFEKVREVSSPDLVFEDPTAPQGLIPARIEGQDAVIAFYKEALPKVEKEIQITHSFESNNYVVLHQNIKGITDVSDFGQEGGKIEFQLPGIAVLYIVDGLVTHYIDYLDYTDIMSKM
ncbi:nuclear transport factor 2 family protein [Tenacibaculum amylolyticum]|uniref:nuclear transport factor 2 family protein n=1 Tax=Tenacibaculum amylolyticum TaxID=104269 RepID=UPI0038944D46